MGFSRIIVICIILLLSAAQSAGFLFTPPSQTQSAYTAATTGFCPGEPECKIRCQHGYMKSTTGCSYCRCTWYGGSSLASAMSSRYLSRPCHPAFRVCNSLCPYGYATAPGGCQYCDCAIGSNTAPAPSVYHTAQTPDMTTTGATLSSRNVVFSIPTTTIRIPRPTVYIQMTSLKPTVHTFIDPCIRGLNTCKLSCGGSYVQGPGGCSYCLCASLLPSPQYQGGASSTTSPPTAATSKLSTNNTLTNQSSMTEACTMAKTLCQMKCAGGFRSRPDDCLYCECTSKPLKSGTESDPGFEVTSPNPCVLGKDKCHLMCISGYLLGPRSCQYCTCR